MKQEKKHFNDLLLPIILTLCVLPFTVYLAEYDYGYDKYLWHSDYSLLQDFYTYYRHIFFLIIIAFALVILAFRLTLYKEHTKDFKLFYPLLGYSVFVLLSSIFSINPKVSWIGSAISIETTFALIGYCLIGFYTYQIVSKQDYKSIHRAIYIMFPLMSVVGWFQVFKHDLLNYEWMQRIVMSDSLFADYGGEVSDKFLGNNVFLTLYNPNFAAIFLVMFSCVFFVFLLYADNTKERILNAIFLLDALILCWFTYTRAALVSLAVILGVFVLCIMKSEKARFIKYILPSVVVLFAVLLIYDASTGRKFINRLFDAPKTTNLESMLTTENGVEFTSNGTDYILSVTPDASALILTDADGNTIPTEYTKDGEMILPIDKNTIAIPLEWEGYPSILMSIRDTSLQFILDEGTYYYYTNWGKIDSIVDIPHVDFHGLESLGSSRVYIWSRILPLLSDYLFIGSGPDTFPEVYPQNDYIGKLIYAENPARITERAHNAFLMHWVQTGLLSLICLLVFYAGFFKKCFVFYKQDAIRTESSKLGFGCFLGCVGYLVCCCFSDSTLYTTPTFYVFIGLALAATQNTNK